MKKILLIFIVVFSFFLIEKNVFADEKEIKVKFHVVYKNEKGEYINDVGYNICSTPDCSEELPDGHLLYITIAARPTYDVHLTPGTYYVETARIPSGCSYKNIKTEAVEIKSSDKDKTIKLEYVLTGANCPTKSEKFNVKFVDSSGEAVSGVKFFLGGESIDGSCTKSTQEATSTSNGVDFNLTLNGALVYVTTSTVPEGYNKLECYPISFDPSNKNIQIPLTKTTEDKQELGTIDVGYMDYEFSTSLVDGISFAVYKNGNCAGEPYATSVSGTLASSVIVPLNTQMSIKPTAYPTDYLEWDGRPNRVFRCTTFMIKYVNGNILLFGAGEYGAKIGQNGERIYVEEGQLTTEKEETTTLPDTPTNPSDNVLDKNTSLELKPKLANFFINGKSVSTNLNVFLENDRTYIDINDLCYHMGCTFDRSDNLITLKFDMFGENVNNLIISQSDLSSITNNINYIITHEVGSKTYSAYLEIEGQRIFSIKSPSTSVESVDVVSLVKDNVLYVPLRFIAEALGRYVTYEPATKDGDYPNIVISSMGEGEFFEQYTLKLSKANLNAGDSLQNEINGTVISLNSTDKLYGFSVNSKNNTVLQTNKTIFYPLLNNSEVSLLKDYIDFGNDNSKFAYQFKDIIKSEKNYIYRINNIESNLSTPFLVISSIEGYPFLRFINMAY